MKITILQNFTIIIQKNELIKWINNDVSLNYVEGEILDNPKDIKFIALKEIYDGNLVMEYEYQLFTGANINISDPTKTTTTGLMTEITDPEALWNYNFFTIEE